MLMKKQLKEQMKTNLNRGEEPEINQDMGELIDSDDQINEADREQNSRSSSISSRGETEGSFMRSDNERESKDDEDDKINNSFTGPYPLDPADFEHKDKGPNF